MRLEESTRLRMNGESNVANDTERPQPGHSQRHGHHHSIRSFTRQCQHIVVNDDGQTRYLVTHRQVGESESKFMCIEFVWRSSTVVQVRRLGTRT